MAKATTAVPPAAKALVRDPAVMGSAALTIVGTVLLALPAFGINLPPKVQKMAGLAFTFASALGIKMTMKPV